MIKIVKDKIISNDSNQCFLSSIFNSFWIMKEVYYANCVMQDPIDYLLHQMNFVNSFIKKIKNFLGEIYFKTLMRSNGNVFS